MSAALPAGYEPLEPFVHWAAPTLAERAALRDASTADERAAFHAAAQPLAARALAMLGDRPLATLDPSERRLLDLMLGFAHVALAVEIQGEAEAEHARARRLMRITDGG